MLPNELCRHAVGLGWIGLIDVESLLPITVIGEAVGLSCGCRVDKCVVGWVVKVETREDVASAGGPCALQRGDVIGDTDAICGLRRRTDEERRQREY